MKSISIYLITLTLIFSCSSQQEKTEFYPSGKISSKFETNSDGLKNGSYVTYYENGQKRSEGKYENDKQTGFWITWFENGNKSSEGKFDQGLQSGEWKFYHKNGKLQQINHYKNNKSEGEFIDFDENGVKTRMGNCINGLLNGKSYEYYPDGKISSELTYKDHKPFGPFIEYFPSGNFRAKGTWNDTVMVGDYFVYDSIDNSNYRKYFFYDNNISSDTGLVYKNNKLVQYRIYDADGNSKYVDIK